ncbi:MAG TPA: hypothetical protein VED59_02255 [Acidimicrobiales bacterium]|nr:hypothetical protein [Acidimicrobiales bacterium]
MDQYVPDFAPFDTIGDHALRERMVAAGRRRAAHFGLGKTSKQLPSAIGDLACKE